jgi:hypothetical protein
MSYSNSKTIDFIVTGPMRSGTTFMASILNSQDSVACLEDKAWTQFGKKLNSAEEFSVMLSKIEANFILLGIPAPSLRDVVSQDELHGRYCKHLRDYFQVKTLGFKTTMMSLREIKMASDSGTKVIIMRRKLEDILKSWVGRISSNLGNAEYKLASYIKSINNYAIPADLSKNVQVIDYELLVSDPDATLREISALLAQEIYLPKIRYHSFNKGRFSFGRNSSFDSSAPPSEKRPSSLLMNTLPSLYTEEDFKLAAQRVSRGLRGYRLFRAKSAALIKKVAKAL